MTTKDFKELADVDKKQPPTKWSRFKKWIVTLPSLKKAEKEISSDAYGKEINKIVLRQIKWDYRIRIAIALVVAFALYKNIHFMHHLIYDEKVNKQIIIEFIRWTSGFDGVLVGVIGYWFTKNGALSVLAKAMDGNKNTQEITVKPASEITVEEDKK